MNPIPEPMDEVPALIRPLTAFDMFEIAARAQQLCDILLDRKLPKYLEQEVRELREMTVLAVQKIEPTIH